MNIAEGAERKTEHEEEAYRMGIKPWAEREACVPFRRAQSGLQADFGTWEMLNPSSFYERMNE